MAISYRRLWKLLIDKYMIKKYLQTEAGVISDSITKFAKNESISTSILDKICIALECDASDIIEIVPEDNPPQNQGQDGTMMEEA